MANRLAAVPLHAMNGAVWQRSLLPAAGYLMGLGKDASRKVLRRRVLPPACLTAKMRSGADSGPGAFSGCQSAGDIHFAALFEPAFGAI